MSKLRQWLLEPKVKDIDVDDNRLLELHSEILQEKRLLQSAFLTFYNDLSALCDEHFQIDGLELELGSGAGFFRKVRNNVITSDIRKSQNIDMVLNAQEMELPNNSVRCFYAINVFHHLSMPNLFFHELIRTVKKGGGCILIEPHNGLFSAWLHKRLHHDEHFNTRANWETEIGGPLSGANQALAHIVFERDLKIFHEKYGSSLELVKTQYELNAFRYLLSGGLNFRQLVPSFLDASISRIERAMKPFSRYWSLHQAIVIKRQ